MAFSATAYEAVTIDNTAGGVGLTAATYGTVNAAIISVETAQIRFTVDGTAPTSAVGMLVDPGFNIYLNSHDLIARFKAIRTGGSSASIHVTYGSAQDPFEFAVLASAADAAGTTTLGAGSAVIGKVGIDQTTPGTTNQVVSSAAITTIKTSVTRPADTNAYTAGDCFSDSTSAPTAGGFTLTSASRTSGGTGRITDAVFSMSAKSSFQGEVWVFDQAVTNTNDNAVITLSAADALNCVGIIPFNVNDTGSVAGLSYVTGLDIRFTCVGSANLRFVVKVITGFTPASAEKLGITLKVEN